MGINHGMYIGDIHGQPQYAHNVEGLPENEVSTNMLEANILANGLAQPVLNFVPVSEITSNPRPATWLDSIVPKEPSPWNPPNLSAPQRKSLGKLGEETNELGTVLFRIHIQGIDEVVPGETKTNRQWLEEEIADVLATSALAVKELKLDMDFIEERMKKKTVYLEKWYMMPDIDKEAKID